MRRRTGLLATAATAAVGVILTTSPSRTETFPAVRGAAGTWHALLHITEDVFNNDDRVIHQHAEREGKREKDDHVQRYSQNM